MLKLSGRRIDLSTPFVDAMLPGGHRLHVVLNGISREFTAVNIRKFVLKAATLNDLVRLESLSAQAAAFLESSVVAGLNVLVAGATQAGKTTMLNCLAAAIPGGDRVISVEEVFELRFPHPDHVAMQTRQSGLEGTGEVTLRDLVRESLRMRPTRMIVGEVRSAECLDLLLALNSGLPGMATLHANSAREALVKMCTLPLLAGDNVSARFVVPTVASSLDLAVHLGVDRHGHRQVNEIVAVPGRVENDIVEIEPIFLRRAVSWSVSVDAPARGCIRARWHRYRTRVGDAKLMGGLLGLSFGAGVLLVWSAFVAPAPPVVKSPSRVRPLLARAGLSEVRPSSFIGLCAGLGLFSFVLVFLASRVVPIALIFGLMGAYAPIAILRGRAHKRQREFAEVWPEAVDNLASAVRAGLSLPEAVSGLGQRGPESLRPAFTAFALDYQVSGRFGDSLDRLKDRLADPVGDRVVEALRIAREVGGGDLGRLLRNLSGYLRDDARTRSELEARQSWAVNGARVAVAAPWLVLLLLCFQPEVIARYSSMGGVVVLTGGAAMCVLAYRLMMHLGRLPHERRILS
ncbi:MAG: ATPase, T2SS/T4P/T4SS family [Nocardioidaceae bacterium]